MVYLTTFLNMALGLFKSVSQRQSAVNGFPFNFGCGNNASEAETTCSVSIHVGSDITQTDDGRDVGPPPPDEDFADGELHPCVQCGNMTLGD